LNLPAMRLEGTTTVSVELFNKDHFTDRRQMKREMGTPHSIEPNYAQSHHPPYSYHSAEREQRQFHYLDSEPAYYPPYRQQRQHAHYYESSPVYTKPYEERYQPQYYPHQHNQYQRPIDMSHMLSSHHESRFPLPPPAMPGKERYGKEPYELAHHSLRASASGYDISETHASSEILFLAKSVVVLTNLPTRDYMQDICSALTQYGTVTDIVHRDGPPPKIEVVVWQTEARLLRLLDALESQAIMLHSGAFVDVESVTSEMIDPEALKK
jgi:hypothetical protein